MRFWLLISFAILFLLILSSCKNDSTVIDDKKSVFLSDTFYQPIDTAAILDSMNLDLEKSSKMLYNRDELDTFDLMWIAYACDCQQWVEIDKYEAYKRKDGSYKDTSHFFPYSFNTDDFAYFIEPAFHDLNLNGFPMTSGSKFRFIGTVEDDPDYHTISLIPLRKQVITYYSYQAVLPMTVFGPQFMDEDTVQNPLKETNYMHLTIEE